MTTTKAAQPTEDIEKGSIRLFMKRLDPTGNSIRRKALRRNGKRTESRRLEYNYICTLCGATKATVTQRVICKCQRKNTQHHSNEGHYAAWGGLGNKPRAENYYKLDRTASEVLIAHENDELDPTSKRRVTEINSPARIVI